MLNSFEKAVGVVLAKNIEGAHSFDSIGGDTWYGIARNFHPNEIVWPVSKERATAIYKEEYWDRYHCGDLPEAIGIALFDAVINQPAVFVIAELQRILHVDPDGVIGPATIAAAKRYDTAELLALFLSHRAMRYMSVSDPIYRLGLVARLFRVQHAILTLQQA